MKITGLVAGVGSILMYKAFSNNIDNVNEKNVKNTLAGKYLSYKSTKSLNKTLSLLLLICGILLIIISLFPINSFEL